MDLVNLDVSVISLNLTCVSSLHAYSTATARLIPHTIRTGGNWNNNADLPRPANAYIYIVPGIPPFCLSMRSTFRWQNILLQSCSRRARLHTNWISILSMAKHTQTATAVHAAAYRLFQRQPAFARECVYKGFEIHQRCSFNNTDTNGMPGLGGTRIQKESMVLRSDGQSLCLFLAHFSGPLG